MLHLIGLVILVVSGVLCHHLAKAKNRSPVWWSAWGTVFGPLALIVLLFLKNNTKDEK